MAHPFEGYIVPVEGDNQDLPVAAPEQQWFVAPDRQQVDYTVPQMLESALSNAVPSGLKALGGLYNLGKFGVNQLNPFNSREEKAQEAIAMAKGISQIPSQYARDYGSPKRFMQSFAEDPVGTGLAVAPFLEVLGALSKAGGLTKAGKTIGNVAAGAASGPAYGISRFLSKFNPKNAIYESMLSEKAPVVSEALKAEPNFPKGYKPTAADLAVYADPINLKFPAMEKILNEKINPEAFKARKLENNKAIIDELSSFGGEDKLKAADDYRKSVSAPLYKEADKAVVPVDSELMTLLNRPAIKDALIDMKRGVENKGGILKNPKIGESKVAPPSIIDPYTQKPVEVPEYAKGSTLTGENLHRMKVAIDEKVNSLLEEFNKGGAGNNSGMAKVGQTVKELLTARNDLVKYIENKIPVYAEARNAYAEASPAVERAKMGTDLIKMLNNPLGEDAALRANKFLNAIDTEKSLISKSTGNPRYNSLAELLTPEQIDSVIKVKNALQNEALKNKAANEGSKAISDLSEQSKVVPNSPKLLSRPLFLYNSLADMINSQKFRKTAKELAQASLSPETSVANISDFINRKEIAKGKASKAARNATKVMYFGKAFEDK